MFRIDTGFIRSRFARRIFLLFVISAIVPVAVTGMLSLSHVSSQLRDQSHELSRQNSKAIGMELIRRLTVARTELISAGESMHYDASGAVRLSPGHRENLEQILVALALIDGHGQAFPLYGTMTRVPRVSGTAEKQLAQGKTLLHLQGDIEDGRDVYLTQQLASGSHAGRWITARVNPAYLWGVLQILPATAGLLIVTPAGEALYGSDPELAAMLPRLLQQHSAFSTGLFEWKAEGDAQLASYWSVFAENNFSVHSLIVMVSQPESVVLATTEGFRTLYIPLLVLVVLAVSMIAAARIRRNLAPLVQLHDATRRVAGGDFSGRLDIRSDDEFAALGQAFNAMSVRLDAQFNSLATMAEIDRLILSSFDARFIVTTVLGRAGDLTPCRTAALLEFGEDNAEVGTLSVLGNSLDAAIVERRVRLSAADLRQLHDNPQMLQLARAAACPAYLAENLPSDAVTLLLFPAFIKQRLAAVMIFGYREQPEDSDEHRGALRKFSDHVAVALTNAAWEEKLYHQAHYDSLTNLPNRALLKDRLEQAIARAARNHTSVGVLFLDLDRFKLVNDSFGHQAGDSLLRDVAGILAANVRDVDTVVRFGGDEFVIIVPDIQGGEEAALVLDHIADKLNHAIRSHAPVDDKIASPGVSIGISLYPRDGASAEELVKNADTAMYQAKSMGRSRHEYYSPEYNAKALRRVNTERELRHALANNELQLYYQPKLETKSGLINRAEALLRWKHPERGMIMPLDFISIAEECGLIEEIGAWVITTACSQIASWRKVGLDTVRVAVNVSPVQFRAGRLAALLADNLARFDVEPHQIELEITEGTLMENSADAIDRLRAFRTMGIRLTLDDFGTGYSSLAYLCSLPLDTLKIDRSFIMELEQKQESHAIVSAIIVLAHKLGLEVVAEGIETTTQKELLLSLGCDELQGYLVGRPAPANEYARLYLGQHQRDSAAERPLQYAHARSPRIRSKQP